MSAAANGSSALVVVTDVRLPGSAFDELEHVEVVPDLVSLQAKPEEVGAVIAVHARVDERLLDRFPNLRVVVRFGIGYDSVDVAACTRRGVQVGITPGPVDASTAELAIALICCARWGILEQDARTRRGEWSAPFDLLPTRGGVLGARLGLVGLGRVGTEVAVRARALGMEVVYASRRESEAARRLGTARLELDELLETSDVVSLHVPLTTETRGLIDARRLASLRDGATLVNTARGAVVDEAALIAELERGRITAALDVYEGEPHVPQRLRELPNTILLPHIGSATRWAREEMTRLAVDNVVAGLAGRSVPHGIPEQGGHAQGRPQRAAA